MESGWDCAWPPSRPCSSAAWWSSGSWSPHRGESGWWFQSTRPSRERGAPAAHPARRRPRRRPLGLPPASDASVLGRALPDREHRQGGERADTALFATRGARGPAPGRRVGRGRVRGAPGRAAGASGFVTKDWDADDIVKAIRMVGMGMTVFDRERERPASPLSDRERGVLQLIATGATNREIAEQLYLSPHTVKEHTSAVYRKLSVRNRTEAVKHAERLGLIT